MTLFRAAARGTGGIPWHLDLNHEVARLLAPMAGQGDGSVEDALRADVAGVDPDAVVARLTEIQDALATLGERRESLSAQRTRAEAKLSEMRAGRDAVTKAQEAEDAPADACAAAERYARLHVARVLLRAGIDRFRGERQGPLLSAAGGHFALLRAWRRLSDKQRQARTKANLVVPGSCVPKPSNLWTPSPMGLARRFSRPKNASRNRHPSLNCRPRSRDGRCSRGVRR